MIAFLPLLKRLTPCQWIWMALACALALAFVRGAMLSANLEAATAKVERLESSEAQLLIKIAEQNEAVLKLKTLSDAQAAKITAADQKIRAEREVAAARVQKLLTARVPEQCEAAVEWGAEVGSDIAKRWKP